MSLSSHLKDNNSLIKQMFDRKFNHIDVFIKEENKKLKEEVVLLPSCEINYPWSIVGHITEYVLALHIGLPFEELFPMRYLKQLDNNQYQKITSLNLVKKDLENSKLKTCLEHLYNLALYESELRYKGDQAIYTPTLLSSIVYEDVKQIYVNSLKNFKDASYEYNPTFDPRFSKYIGGADADLIEYKQDGNNLIDIKTTKHNRLERTWIYQLMGYVALDKNNEHNLKHISIYLPRQNIALEYDVEDVLQKYTQLKSIDELRSAFGFALISHIEPFNDSNTIRFTLKS